MAAKLTKEDFPAFSFYFEVFDANASGKMNISELGQVMDTLHATSGNSKQLTEKQLGDLLKEADANADGSLDFSEFLKAYGIVLKRRLQDKDDARAMEDAFYYFEADGNQCMSAVELGQLMKVLGEQMTEEEVVKMLEKADVNKDNQFRLDEFTKMMEKKYRCGVEKA